MQGGGGVVLPRTVIVRHDRGASTGKARQPKEISVHQRPLAISVIAPMTSMLRRYGDKARRFWRYPIDHAPMATGTALRHIREATRNSARASRHRRNLIIVRPGTKMGPAIETRALISRDCRLKSARAVDRP